MSDGETKIKILKLEKLKDENLAVIAIEQGKIQSWTLLRSDRTSTTYHITERPLFLTDLEMLIYPSYPELLCDYYRSHKDFATNKQMQEICETKRGFSTAPILFAKITIAPFSERFVNPNLHFGWEYIDTPENFDVEVGDTFTSFEL